MNNNFFIAFSTISNSVGVKINTTELNLNSHKIHYITFSMSYNEFITSQL